MESQGGHFNNSGRKPCHIGGAMNGSPGMIYFPTKWGAFSNPRILKSKGSSSQQKIEVKNPKRWLTKLIKWKMRKWKLHRQANHIHPGICWLHCGTSIEMDTFDIYDPGFTTLLHQKDPFKKPCLKPKFWEELFEAFSSRSPSSTCILWSIGWVWSLSREEFFWAIFTWNSTDIKSWWNTLPETNISQGSWEDEFPFQLVVSFYFDSPQQGNIETYILERHNIEGRERWEDGGWSLSSSWGV